MTDTMRGRGRHSQEWKPHYPKEHPVSVEWRVSRLEETADHHEERLVEIEGRPEGPTPWIKAIALLGLLGLGVKGHLAPDTIGTLLKSLLP